MHEIHLPDRLPGPWRGEEFDHGIELRTLRVEENTLGRCLQNGNSTRRRRHSPRNFTFVDAFQKPGHFSLIRSFGRDVRNWPLP